MPSEDVSEKDQQECWRSIPRPNTQILPKLSLLVKCHNDSCSMLKCKCNPLRWSRGRVLAFSTQVRGFKPVRSRRNLGAKKILSTPSFGGGVKPSVPYRRFAAGKRFPNLSGSRNLGKITGQISRPQFHLSLLGSLASLRTYRHLAAKVGKSKGGRKQWQTTPKHLPGMQCARAVPVTWLGSGSCQPGL